MHLHARRVRHRHARRHRPGAVAEPTRVDIRAGPGLLGGRFTSCPPARCRSPAVRPCRNSDRQRRHVAPLVTQLRARTAVGGRRRRAQADGQAPRRPVPERARELIAVLETMLRTRPARTAHLATLTPTLTPTGHKGAVTSLACACCCWCLLAATAASASGTRRAPRSAVAGTASWRWRASRWRPGPGGAGRHGPWLRRGDGPRDAAPGTGYSDAVRCVALMPTASPPLTGGDDRGVRLADVDRATTTTRFTNTRPVTGVALSLDGGLPLCPGATRRCACGDGDGQGGAGVRGAERPGAVRGLVGGRQGGVLGH